MLTRPRVRKTRPKRRTTVALLATMSLLGTTWLPTQPASGAPLENLVVNPGFEDGDAGWSAGNGGTFTLSDDAATGSQSGSLSERTAFYHGLKGTLTTPLDPAGRYKIDVKIKHMGGAATEPFGFAFCPASGGCVAAANAIKQVPRGEWSDYSLEFVPNQSPNYDPAKHDVVTFPHFQLETPWSSTVPFLIDDATITRLDDPAKEPLPVGEGHVENVQTKPVGDHNPLMGHKFGADPHHVIFNNRLYIYSTSDEQQYQTGQHHPNGLPLKDGGYDRITTLNVISTDDMVNWVDHGAVPVAGPNGTAKWAGNSWAPAAISADPDGDGVEEIYLYFCNGGSGTGVIVGGSPLGPWEDPNGKMLISQGNPIEFPAGMWLFDPEIFVDDDGQPYLYFGGNWDFAGDPYHPKSTRVVKLDPKDYTKLADPTGGGITEIDGPGMFEASSMFKRGDKYYYSYSSNFGVGNPDFDNKKIEGQAYPGAGEIAYSISDSPLEIGREDYAGTAFASHGKWFPGSGGNNHSDIFTYKGKDYFTYHTQVQGIEWGKALNDGRTVNYRSVHLDEINFAEDGTIEEVVGTKAGVEQIKNFDPYRTFEAETLAWQLGVRTAPLSSPAVEFPEHNGNGNMVLTNIDDGDFTGISQVDFGNGAKALTAKVKPMTDGVSMEVRLDSETGPVVATLEVDTPEGEWAEVTTQVDPAQASGVHDLFFVFRGTSGERLIEVDNFTFTQETASDPEVRPVSIHSAGEKVVGATTNLWGNAPDFAGQTVSGEALVGEEWVNVGQSTVRDDGFYVVPLGDAVSRVGSYTVRVRIGDTTSEAIPFKRISRTTFGASPVAAVDSKAYVWGSVDGEAKVFTQVYIPGAGWSTSQIRTTDTDGHFFVPLTYGRNKAGTYRWRVVVDHDHGEREVLREFSQRRVARPTATSAGQAPIGRAASVWGTVDGVHPTSVWTEVQLPDGRWAKSQQTTTGSHGGYVLPLTYGQHNHGTLSWRVAAHVEGIGTLYSDTFVFRRS